MKVGIALPPVATDPENLRMVATEAEKMGYDSLWTNERLLVPASAKPPYPGNADGSIAPAAWLTGQEGRRRLGCH
jgi:alkanesulfonate monooxygenase SsuD/methylene tetrahydromethanopterin reductase-like flavin-dependent oxidoreductase (luciferase family)